MLTMSGVAVRFGAHELLRDVGFTVARGERWGVIGRNGSGKTTLLDLVLGRRDPDAGVVSVGPGTRVAVLDQHRDFGAAHTVWEAAAGQFAELQALERSLAEQAEALGHSPDEAALERYGRDLERFEHAGGYALAARVDAVLHGLGFDPAAARESAVATLSGGERSRLGLARQLAAPADLLLLDEPTNHLDLDTTAWLQAHLQGLDCAVLVVSHDRAFLEAVTDHTLHLEHGTATAYTGPYSAFVRQHTERRLAVERAYQKQRREVAATEDFIRRNIAGQNSAQAKGRRRRLERLPRLSPPPGSAGAMSIRLEPGARGGDQVIVAKGVAVSVGGRELLSEFSATLRRGEVVGLVGPNGAGKTTLLRVLLGEALPSAGEVRLGEGITPAWYRQDFAQLPSGGTVYQAIEGRRPSWGRGAVQNHLGAFGFSGDAVLRNVAVLSGGERARLALALMVLDGANLLVFDEPTNHLDVESIEVLEDALEAFEGTVLLVSHDRALLENLVERTWALEDGRITDYPGSFREWEEARPTLRSTPTPRAKPPSPGQEARRAGRDERTARRRAEGAVTDAEAAVVASERRLGELQEQLANPALYTGEGGVREATALGEELEEVRRAHDEAMRRWVDAVEARDALAEE